MITITDTDLESIFKTLLQQKVDIIVNKKIWKSGKFLLFKQSGFNIELTIRNKRDKNERFEIPIPFDIKKTQGSVKLSYELNSLVCNKPDIVQEIKKLIPKGRNKYYNNTVEIRIL